ncbi:MAG TPA: hypothetical protein VMB81_09575 [Candidatus Sulfotelmatobacter sp.]|nr:hypothetical protein [Candidatus Sulfotelmatobacter sp.]
MRRFCAPGIVALGLALSGCAAVLTGTADSVTVNSEPTGAECHVDRMSQPIAVIKSTPETVRIVRSSYPVEITCSKEGLAGALTVTPGVNPYTYLDLLGGGVPYLADSLTDADRDLPESVLVQFPVQR